MRPLYATSLGIGAASVGGILGILGAAAALSRSLDLDGHALLGQVPAILFSVALLFAAIVLVALAHLARRTDLLLRERIALLVGILLVPGGAVLYLAFGRDRTREAAKQALRALDGPPATRAPPS